MSGLGLSNPDARSQSELRWTPDLRCGALHADHPWSGDLRRREYVRAESDVQCFRHLSGVGDLCPSRYVWSQHLSEFQYVRRVCHLCEFGDMPGRAYLCSKHHMSGRQYVR